jgi:hypothetical protein
MTGQEEARRFDADLDKDRFGLTGFLAGGLTDSIFFNASSSENG